MQGGHNLIQQFLGGGYILTCIPGTAINKAGLIQGRTHAVQTEANALFPFVGRQISICFCEVHHPVWYIGLVW